MYYSLMAGRSGWRIGLALFSWTIALRAATAVAMAWTIGVSFKSLAVFFDGHLYLLVGDLRVAAMAVSWHIDR